jgi:hypothetical protein
MWIKALTCLLAKNSMIDWSKSVQNEKLSGEAIQL